ncbi:MAG: hypothetical protein UY03_C0002G0002 [Parcubacteria group bacterium GW2011_GWA2_47_64]|nr:MAG: hypothetical protein UY03_C0002G0002 [Parcubacteria group bacterium GW2011_GWA2_47_64]KKU96718.1 MAG: hypothetical protein UY29_C0007G0004 [Parcubacteria group bacterium GW2011_GWC2_48_17]
MARKERRRKIRKIFLLSVLFTAAAAGIVYGLSRPELRIISIEVAGSRQVQEELIQRTVANVMKRTYLWFIPKSHTLLYPKTELKESLMKEFPALSGVSISLKSLSALRVFVYEREPQALWCASRQECSMMDKTGFVFAPAEMGMEQMYYRFLKMDAKAPIGTEVIPQEELSKLLLFLKKLEMAGLEPREVLLKEQDELEVVLSFGTRLLLRSGNYDTALINLETLMEQDNLLSRNKGELSVSYIDLRYGNKIYFKPR